MRANRILSDFFLIAVIFVTSAFAQQTATTIQRDPQAFSILQQCLSASGSTAMGAIQDFTATGNVTYNWGNAEVQGAITIKGLGTNDFRMDSTVSNGAQSWVVNHLSGALMTTDGKTHSLPPYNLINSGSLTLPLIRVAAALSDTSTALRYVGQVSVDSYTAYAVQVTPTLDPSIASVPALSGVGTLTLYVDTASYQVLKATELLRSENDFTQTYVEEITFSDYRLVDGVSVPFLVAERFGGQRTWSVVLNSISFNTGLTDSDFTLQ